MKLFIVFLALSFFNPTFAQANKILQTPKILQTENLETYPKEVLQAEASIWEIYNNFTQGTGFFIGPNLFVTNFHVLSSLLRGTGNLNGINLSQEGNPNILNIKQVVSVSALYDLAIIETKETSQHHLNLSENKIRADENLFSVGYPDRVFTRMKKTGKINYEDDYLFSFPSNHYKLYGASGSPVLNAQGQVVGIYFRGGNTNLILAIKLNHFKKPIAIGQNCKSKSIKICIKKEMENLRIIAKQGHTLAQKQLAYFYYKGRETNQNYKLASYWFLQAAKQGDSIAQYELAIMYYEGKGVVQNFKEALELFYKSAEQGYFLAQNNLAMMYFEGKGIDQNFTKALEWYQKAAEQNYANAQNELGSMYYEGKGVVQNFKEALKWFQKAAEQGNVKAQFNLGLMYLNEEGVPKNYKKAFEWFQQSAKQGYAEAQNNLAYMYQNGIGTEKNLKLAKHWLKQSKPKEAIKQNVLDFNFSSLAVAQTNSSQTENLETYPKEVLEAEKAIWKNV